jgi:transcriptional antiterminator RfaH
VKTKQPSSKEALTNVRNQGFDYFHPMMRLQSVRAVRRAVPVFPYYLMVRVDDRRSDWRALCSTRGVSYMLMDGERPGVVRDDVVEDLRRLSEDNDDGYYHDASQEAPRFKPDSVVLGTRGLFQDHFGTYKGLAGNRAERVRVLFKILGKDAEFEVNAVDLVAAA